jgi:putative FmdB family regulatory protein
LVRDCIFTNEPAMPMYEYRCRKCGKSFELLRRMADADCEVECPECLSDEVDRLLSAFSSGGCGTAGSGKFT